MITPDFTELKLKLAGDLAWLVLSRPAKRNAVNSKMLEELVVVCQFLENQKDLRGVIVTGEAGIFCAGGDIDQWSKLNATDFAMDWVRQGHVGFDGLARLRHPVVGVLNGHTLGGGFELAACCDYRIAEDHIRIGQPESSIGIIPGWSGSQRAVRRFGAQAIRRMAMFGEILDARQAYELGLVDRLVKKGEGHKAAEELLSNLQTRGKKATQIVKLLINAAEDEERERVLEVLAGHVVAGSTELAEGLTAFREKRRNT